MYAACPPMFRMALFFCSASDEFPMSGWISATALRQRHPAHSNVEKAAAAASVMHVSEPSSTISVV